jgi:hypothetical protein
VLRRALLYVLERGCQGVIVYARKVCPKVSEMDRKSSNGIQKRSYGEKVSYGALKVVNRGYLVLQPLPYLDLYIDVGW